MFKVVNVVNFIREFLEEDNEPPPEISSIKEGGNLPEQSRLIIAVRRSRLGSRTTMVLPYNVRCRNVDPVVDII